MSTEMLAALAGGLFGGIVGGVMPTLLSPWIKERYEMRTYAIILKASLEANIELLHDIPHFKSIWEAFSSTSFRSLNSEEKLKQIDIQVHSFLNNLKQMGNNEILKKILY